MIRYQEILRLHSQGVPFKKEITDADLQELLFPEKNIQSSRKSPDCPYIHKEMVKNGVTLSLLWHEYCEQCRLSNEIPLMYSQFCRYYRKFANTTKATMRIKRKPGEMMEVDWTGKTAFIIDNVTGEPIPAYVYVAVLSWIRDGRGTFCLPAFGESPHGRMGL